MSDIKFTHNIDVVETIHFTPDGDDAADRGDLLQLLNKYNILNNGITDGLYLMSFDSEDEIPLWVEWLKYPYRKIIIDNGAILLVFKPD